jgi:hypothetical protein
VRSSRSVLYIEDARCIEFNSLESFSFGATSMNKEVVLQTVVSNLHFHSSLFY